MRIALGALLTAIAAGVIASAPVQADDDDDFRDARREYFEKRHEAEREYWNERREADREYYGELRDWRRDRWDDWDDDRSFRRGWSGYGYRTYASPRYHTGYRYYSSPSYYYGSPGYYGGGYYGGGYYGGSGFYGRPSGGIYFAW